MGRRHVRAQRASHINVVGPCLHQSLMIEIGCCNGFFRPSVLQGQQCCWSFNQNRPNFLFFCLRWPCFGVMVTSRRAATSLLMVVVVAIPVPVIVASVGPPFKSNNRST